MIKLAIAAAASLVLVGVCGAQTTGGNTMSGEPGSAMTTKPAAKKVVHKRVVTYKTTHHTTTTSPGTMANSM